MPSLSDVLGGALQNAINHWKSTVQSFLTLALVTCPILTVAGVVHGKVLLWCAIAPAIAKAWLGMTQNDGVQVVMPPLPPGATQSASVVTKVPCSTAQEDHA